MLWFNKNLFSVSIVDQRACFDLTVALGMVMKMTGSHLTGAINITHEFHGI